jgi:hypothetical protein
MRPSKMTPEAVETFLQATRLGATRELAGAAAGWSETTTYRYLEAGRDAETKAEGGQRLTPTDQRAREFREAVKKAEAVMAQAALAQIIRAAQMPQHWTAAAWLLERRWPSEYGRPARVEVTGRDGGPIPIEVTASELLDQRRRVKVDEEAQEAWRERRRPRAVVPEDVAGNGHKPEEG